MSEELQNVQVEQVNLEPVENKTPDTQVNVDPYEAEAKEQGWKPKEEYEGDPAKWRPAREFVERGELFGKIDSMGRELKETRKALKMLQEHNAKIKETEYKRAVEELKSLQKKHLEEGNSDGYLETTELLTDLKAEQKAREVVTQNTPNQPDPRFLSWVDKNKWYTADNEMRKYADILGSGYAQSNPGLDPEEVLDYVTEQVKHRFATKFKNPNRDKPSAVEGTTQSAAPNKSTFELTDEERKVMNTFVRTGAMTKEDFIAQVKAMRGVK